MAKFLVTGVAGFIGMHVALRLLGESYDVVGVDNLNAYYDVKLKEARLAQLQRHPHFSFQKLDLADRSGAARLFEATPPSAVVHLAAQAGVRYSLQNPHAYVESNLVGFVNILEGCRRVGVKHLVFASSSSVYGANTQAPFSVRRPADHPVSLYAATKKSNELLAHAYSDTYALPATAIRFFTVYGPWGRPDMAYFLFTKSILAGKPIQVFNYGKMQRDFTYIDDVVEGVARLVEKIPAPDPHWSGESPQLGTSRAPFRIYNIGNNQPVELLHFIEVLENTLGKKAEKIMLPLQPGDVSATCAEIDDLIRDVGFRPSTPLEVGIRRFVDWYQSFYGDRRA